MRCPVTEKIAAGSAEPPHAPRENVNLGGGIGGPTAVVHPSGASMPTGHKIVPDEYLALHSNEVICSIVVTPSAPVTPWLIVGTNQGDILFYPADVNHTIEAPKIHRHNVHPDSPIEAIACGKLTGACETEVVTVSADGTLATFMPPQNEGDRPTFIYQQLIQANVRAAYVMDVDGDGFQELIIILTDRVVRTYRYEINSLIPINKWEVPCQITAFAVGVYDRLTETAELILSQMGASYFISIPLSGKLDKVDLVHQLENKSLSVMMLTSRTRFAGIMGSMMDNLAIRGRSMPTVLKERPLENTGFPLIGSCACIMPDGLELIATVDIRGMVLIYAVTKCKTPPPEAKEHGGKSLHPQSQERLKSVSYFETDESCEYMVMTAIDRTTVMMSVANIFRHLFLYKISVADIHDAMKNSPSQ